MVCDVTCRFSCYFLFLAEKEFVTPTRISREVNHADKDTIVLSACVLYYPFRNQGRQEKEIRQLKQTLLPYCTTNPITKQKSELGDITSDSKDAQYYNQS